MTAARLPHGTNTTPTPAAAIPTPPAPARAFLPGELRTLGALLDGLESAHIRLYLDTAGALRFQAPRGAMTPDLRAQIAAHKGQLARVLRAAGAIGEGPAVPTATTACHDLRHLRPPVYSFTLGRWLCVTCEPDTFALFVRAVHVAYDARTAPGGREDRPGAARGAAGDSSTDAPSSTPSTDTARLDRGPLMRELLAWGEAHDWPALPYAWRTGASGPHGADHGWYKAIMAGAAAWRRFVSGNPAAELLAAQRAAAVSAAAQAQGVPLPVRRVENNRERAQCVACGGPIAPCQGERIDRDPTEYGTAFRHPICPASRPAPEPIATAQELPGAALDASMIADRAPDGPPAQAGTGASMEEAHAGEALDTGAAGGDLREDANASEGEASDPPREWPECFAALDAGGLWLARVGAHSAAGAPERRELDDLTRPDPSSACAAHLLACMVRERITQLWVHPTWAAAVGLPMRELGQRQTHDGVPHAFAASGPDGASWATDDSPAGLWGMYHAGRLAPWLRFYRRGEAGTLAIALPHLDGRVPWRQAADARELLAAILAYRAALRGLAYRSGPGATSTALLRAVHRGSSAALDLSASATPRDFPAPAHAAGLMPQWGWIRERTAAERERGRYVIGLDKNGMFLAACSSLRVGLGAAPDHLDAADPADAERLAACVEALTDWQSRPRPRRPVGYWLARVTFPAPDHAAPAWLAAGLLPHPCYTHPKQPDPAESWQWYASPTLVLAAELGARVEVREAHVWRQADTHEPLEPWYQRLRDARAALMRARAAGAPGAGLALAAVKATYVQGIGWLDGAWLRKSEAPTDLYRPDWRHAAISTANANLLRNLARGYDASGGCSPFCITNDETYYITESPDPDALAAALGLRMGEGLGLYKVKLAPLPLAELAPVWDVMAAGREPGRAVSEFKRVIRASED